MKSIFPVTKKDLRVDTFCSGGPGGQHQNKTESGVRITHIETGISAECRESRSQKENKRRALHKLAQRLLQEERLREMKTSEVVKTRIRTYHEPRGVVTDHRSGLRYSYDDIITNCKFGPIHDMIQRGRLAQFQE